ncbi:class I SAM-dependent methyltransferase [bacterium]|nr:class I SAM-dependent methyltransferase [bacterium]MBU1985443.1 class I SAM-dependent methyltransferase [bacterium]
MDPQEHLQKTKSWLEERYRQGVAEGQYLAHRPIYGFGHGPTERNHTARMALALAILRVLNRLDARTLVDLGGGEGYVAALARDVLGYDPLLVELPDAACERARELFGMPAASLDIHNLPWEDNSIDVVLLSEVVEHLNDPFRALAEAFRVARKALIVTTGEAVPWEWERTARLKLREVDRAHAELTIFHKRDFIAAFGTKVRFLNPCLIYPLEDETVISEEQARRLVPRLAESRPYGPGSLGFLALILKDENALRSEERVKDAAVIEGLFRFSVPVPNVSRAAEVKWPEWIRERTANEENTKRDPYDPLSAKWSDSDRRHLQKLFALRDRHESPSGGQRLRAKITLACAAGLRLLLAPGNPFGKLAWVIRHLRGRYMRKVLSG